MNRKIIAKQAKYWYLSARHDYNTMLSLFKSNCYSDTLFYGHIVIEKTLKSLIVIEKGISAPMVHDLLILVKNTNLSLTQNELYLLEKINQFNIRARYPDYKLNFYKICDRPYTINYLNKIIELYKNICLNSKLKKLPETSPNS